ncbi:DNA polymerase I [Thermofilum adornatum]|uniref:DNA polymerase n=1 Tax=Thermofilum adornatum TaxID=1365176 RepID=S5Z6C5_9CREN|nr:DNA-directed DNA polymerase I [Thermofilum adornatum]AGT34870.1 DNA polymerase I [Thermofilum adornatum]
MLYLLSVKYNGKEARAEMYFYDDEKHVLVRVPDYSDHHPYLLTDLKPDELAERYPDVLKHKGFNRLDVVEKYDPLSDRWILMTKVEALDPLSIGGAKDSIREQLKGHAWEAKIKYHHCYIYDSNLIPGMPYTLEDGKPKIVLSPIPEHIEKLIREMVKDKTELAEYLSWAQILNTPIPKLKRIAIDIEVESPQGIIPKPENAEKPVIAVAYYASDGQKGVLLLKRWQEVPEIKLGDAKITVFEDEKSLLAAAFSLINAYPVVLTFNGDNFDLPYLYNRAKKLGFKPEEIPIEWSPKAEYAELKNAVHIDLYAFFTNRSMRVYAFGNKYREGRTLDEVASALLGIGKVKHDEAISEMTPERLVEYNLRDAELTYKLTAFNDDLVVKLIILMMRISKLPIEDLTRHNISAWIRNMFYYEHRQRGWLIPNPEDILSIKGQTSTKAIIKGKKYMGAIVINPKPGVYFNVVVVDFASLYPSVIKKWNLSYETVRCPHEECRDNKIPGTPHWVCKRKRGLMSEIIGILRDLRVYVYKKGAKASKDEQEKMQYEVIQSALKVFLNASYGVFGAESFSLYCPPVAESTTALGRYSILKTMEKAVKMGIPVLYGDTDSLFLWNPTQDKLESLLQGVLNDLQIDLSIDKEYKWVVFSKRKKNYLGLLKEGKVDIKGLTGKKRNTPDYIKNVFSDIIAELSKADNILVFEKSVEKVEEKVKDSLKHLKKHEVPLDQLAFKVALTKSLKEYTKTTPQHVKAARQLLEYRKKLKLVPPDVKLEEAVPEGEIIAFVKTRNKEGVKAVQVARLDEIDPDKYIEIMKTTLQQVLDALEIDFEDLLEGKTQTLF